MSYAKLKNAELEELLKERGLAHTGKKAELIARLTEDDAAKTGGNAPASGEGPNLEDGSTTEPPPVAAAQAAGGAGKQVPNPTAVPNQQITKPDPSKTDDLTVAAAPSANGAESKPDDGTVPAPEKDFSSGLKSTAVDDELAKRQKRAARFGIDQSDEKKDDEALKALERAKRFGTDTQAVKGLDAPLPEKSRAGKRGRGRDDEEGGGGGRRGGGKRSRVREGGGGGGGAGLNEKDRLAAEARKKRFG